MRIRSTIDRWRRGERLVLIGLVVVVVGVLGPWLRQDLHESGDKAVYVLRGYGASTSYAATGLTRGLGGIGHPWLELVLLPLVMAVLVLVLALRSGPGRPTYGAVTGLVVAVPVTILGLVATAVRLLAFLPGIRVGEALQDLPLYQGADPELPKIPAEDAVVGWGGWVGLAGLVLLVVGLWVALADDHTQGRDDDDRPPALRPVPTTSAVDADGRAGTA